MSFFGIFCKLFLVKINSRFRRKIKPRYTTFKAETRSSIRLKESGIMRIGALSMTGAAVGGLLVTAVAALWELGTNDEHSMNAANARTCLMALNEPLGHYFEADLNNKVVSDEVRYTCQQTVKRVTGADTDSTLIRIDPYKFRRFAYEQERKAEFHLEPSSFIIGGIVVAMGAWKLSPVMTANDTHA